MLNVEQIPNLTSREDLLSRLHLLAEIIKSQHGAEYGIGMWSGSIKSNSTLKDYGDSHIAVFGGKGLLTPILDVNIETSDSIACLLGLLLQNSDLLISTSEQMTREET